MGICYGFRNKTKKEHAKYKDSFPKLYMYTNFEKKEIFEDVIRANGWDSTDAILAMSEYDEYLYYNGNISSSKEYTVKNIIVNETASFYGYDFHGMNLMSINELREFFKDLISKYRWNENDIVVAKCDEDEKEIAYQNDVITITYN